jgi:prepilin-type N-terminal cleavage/methylation domain-containing protein
MVARRGGESGVTLVELLIAISLSSVVVLMALSLFKDVGFAVRLTGGKGEAVVLNRRNRRVTYAWGDSVLKANGKAYGFRLASLSLEPAGPVRPAWQAFAGEMPWELDSLDGDHNGTIDSTELDRNGNGELETEECRFLASVRVTLVASVRGIPITLTTLVHPRNRAREGTGTEDGDPDGPGGIPEP